MGKYRVLVLINTGMVYYGGLTTAVLNYYRNMDKTDLQIDFASPCDTDEIVLNELSSNDSRYFRLPDRNFNILKYYNALCGLCKYYDVVHVNGNSATMSIELQAAKQAGVKRRIAHCHTSKTGHPIINKMLTGVFKNSYTTAVACSDLAGEWLFGKGNYCILPNAIDLKKYKKNDEVRERVRNDLQIRNSFVLGHVGKLNEGKNHKYIFNVFVELMKLNSNSKLMLVGDGPLNGELHKLASELGILEHVIFTGMVSNVHEYIQAMDSFVFPSFFEGLPLSVVEAQAAGKRCYISDRVTSQVAVTKESYLLSIDADPKLWAEHIYNDSKNAYDYASNEELLYESEFNIYKEAYKLQQIYKGNM